MTGSGYYSHQGRLNEILDALARNPDHWSGKDRPPLETAAVDVDEPAPAAGGASEEAERGA